jgi:acyl-CoA thioesterase I
VPDGTDGVIVELGANDALRGLDPAQTREALADIVERLKAREIEVLLAGMYAPPNMGDDYRDAFDSIYPDLAAEFEVVFYPFFLDGVALDPSLNLNDGMHPNDAGIDVIVERILPSVEELIARIEAQD